MMKSLSRNGVSMRRLAGITMTLLLAFTVGPVAAQETDTSLMRIKERERLKVCADKYALPFSSMEQDIRGLDNEMAAEIANRIGVRLELVWMDTGAWGGRSKGVMRRMVFTKECDCVVGLPIKVAEDLGFASTRPYLGTCFALAVPKGGQRFESVDELEGARVCAPSNSPPWRVLYDRGWNPSFVYRYGWEILKAVDGGELEAGFVWGASAGWYLLNHPELEVDLIPTNVMLPQFRWNTAVALRPGEDALREEIDRILAELVQSGAVEKLATKYGIPYFPPFEIVEDQ